MLKQIGAKIFVKIKQGFQNSVSGIGPWLNPHPLYKQAFDCGKYVSSTYIKLGFNFPFSYWKTPIYAYHSRLREKSSQTKYQKNYPSKSKASFQYLYMRKVHEKILRVCFQTSLGDFGPQTLLISPNSQFFIKQHREVNNTILLDIFIL